MKNILNKLHEARKIVRSGKYKKDGRNEYSKYDYFTPEMVEKIVSEVTEAQKMICICNLRRDEHGLYQELKLIDLEKEGEDITFELATTMGEMKATNQTQQMGGTDTYSERYIKMKVFQIKDNNLDFDSHDNREQVKITPVKPQNALSNAKQAVLEVSDIEELETIEKQIKASTKLTKEEKDELKEVISLRAKELPPFE